MKILEIEEFSAEVLEALNALLPQLSASAPVLTAAGLGRVLNTGTTRLLMALEEGTYCGTLTLVTLVVPTGVRARIEDVVVHSSMRGRGIGRRLVAHALHIAGHMGAASVDLTSHPSRTAANALYQKMGFVLRETNSYEMKCKV